MMETIKLDNETIAESQGAILRKIDALLSDDSQGAVEEAAKPAPVRTNLLRPLRAEDVSDEPTPWILENHIPDETLFCIVGRPGDGKSTIAERIAADLSAGRTPQTMAGCSPRDVLILNNEDAPGRIRSRFVAADGDITKLHIENLDDLWSLHDKERLENTIEAFHIGFVVIDSLGSHCGKTDLNSLAETAQLLNPLRGIAEKHKLAIAVVHHTNKSQSPDHQQRVSGSTGISASFRHFLHVAVDPDDSDMRLLANGKSNLAPQGVLSIQFHLSPCRWAGESGRTLEDVYQLGGVDGEKPGDAEKWLRETLSDGEWRNAANIVRQAEAGYGISRSSIYRAAGKIPGLERRRETFGGKTDWRLEKHQESQESQESHSLETEIVDTDVRFLTARPNIKPENPAFHEVDL